MDSLAPMEILYDSGSGTDVPLPHALAEFYGRLSFPHQAGTPYVISNFVSSIDGVAALDTKGKLTGEVISGYSDHDSCVMGLLRASSDAVIVGAGTLAASPQHLWTPEYVFPSYSDAYKELRAGLHKEGSPITVIVSERGSIDPSHPVFHTGSVQVLIVTTRDGFTRLHKMDLPPWVRVSVGDTESSLSSRQVLDAITKILPSASMILVEGGPHLMGYFIAEQAVNELFLTLAPHLAGRSKEEDRMGIVAEKLLAPDHPAWGTLVSARRAGSHLFLRYAFHSTTNIVS
jgi:riboflavin biosynthesis pyrimidine reductase